jgi:hypothetical protein
MYVDEGGIAIIEESELYSGIRSDGCVTLNNSIIYRGCLYINSGQVIMKNSTLYGVIDADHGWEAEIEIEFKDNTIYGNADIQGGKATFEDNTIYGNVSIKAGKATFDGNTIIGDSEDKNDWSFQKAITVGSEAVLNLINNTVFGPEIALFLYDDSRVFISRNRFDSGRNDGIIIDCEWTTTTLKTDGTNRLLNPNCRISCSDFPELPGSELF